MRSNPFKAELIKQVDRLETENNLLLRYFWDTERKIETDAVASHDGYTGRLYRTTMAAGGYVVLSYPVDTETPSHFAEVQIFYLDDLAARFRGQYSEHSLPIRIIIERLESARRRILDAENVASKESPVPHDITTSELSAMAELRAGTFA